MPFAEAYGATTQATIALIANLAPDAARHAGAVQGWLEDAGARVVARVGLPDSWGSVDPHGELRRIGAACTQYGAAALLHDALYPERAVEGIGATNYGGVLWARHQLLLAELEVALGVRRDVVLGGIGGNAAGSVTIRSSLSGMPLRPPDVAPVVLR